MNQRLFTTLTLCAAAAVCPAAETYRTLGSLDSHDPRFDKIVSPEAKIEVVGEGFSWIEGPLWLPSENCLVFSNIPPNRLWKWTEKEGAVHYLEKSGYLGKVPRDGFKGAFDQAGSNGLILAPDGSLVLCQHGLRQIGRMKAPGKACPMDSRWTMQETSSRRPRVACGSSLPRVSISEPSSQRSSPATWHSVPIRRRSSSPLTCCSCASSSDSPLPSHGKPNS